MSEKVLRQAKYENIVTDRLNQLFKQAVLKKGSRKKEKTKTEQVTLDESERSKMLALKLYR
jgi:hypothetical protein